MYDTLQAPGDIPIPIELKLIARVGNPIFTSKYNRSVRPQFWLAVYRTAMSGSWHVVQPAILFNHRQLLVSYAITILLYYCYESCTDALIKYFRFNKRTLPHTMKERRLVRVCNRIRDTINRIVRSHSIWLLRLSFNYLPYIHQWRRYCDWFLLHDYILYYNVWFSAKYSAMPYNSYLQ